MVLRLPDKWVWDFWFARNGGEDHIFYLQAPRELGRPELRHHNATIGHAASGNRRKWQVLPDAVHPGTDGSWDDLATWTGSISSTKPAGTCFTRASVGPTTAWCNGSAWQSPTISSIGPSTLLTLCSRQNPRWYEVLDQARHPHQAWRDPWLFRNEEDGLLHVLVTAHRRVGAPDGAGVLGHACSKDLVEWRCSRHSPNPGSSPNSRSLSSSGSTGATRSFFRAWRKTTSGGA